MSSFLCGLTLWCSLAPVCQDTFQSRAVTLALGKLPTAGAGGKQIPLRLSLLALSIKDSFNIQIPPLLIGFCDRQHKPNSADTTAYEPHCSETFPPAEQKWSLGFPQWRPHTAVLSGSSRLSAEVPSPLLACCRGSDYCTEKTYSLAKFINGCQMQLGCVSESLHG